MRRFLCMHWMKPKKFFSPAPVREGFSIVERQLLPICTQGLKGPRDAFDPLLAFASGIRAVAAEVGDEVPGM